jgi:hypothetical protein
MGVFQQFLPAAGFAWTRVDFATRGFLVNILENEGGMWYINRGAQSSVYTSPENNG